MNAAARAARDSRRLFDASPRGLRDCISRSRDAEAGVRVQADERTTGRVYRRALRTSLPVLQSCAPKARSAAVRAITDFCSAYTRMVARGGSLQQSRNIEGRFTHVNCAPDGHPGWRIRACDHSSFSHRDDSIQETRRPVAVVAPALTDPLARTAHRGSAQAVAILPDPPMRPSVVSPLAEEEPTAPYKETTFIPGACPGVRQDEPGINSHSLYGIRLLSL